MPILFPSRHAVALATLTLLFSAQVSAQQAPDSTVITGTLRGADGRIPVRADVQLTPIRDPARIARARVAADGSFRIASASTGPPWDTSDQSARSQSVHRLGSPSASRWPVLHPT
jgi:hypothetical protein